MVKIKYDVSDSDPDRAAAGPRDLAPVGIHTAKLIECNYREPGKDKAEGKDPDLECVYEFEDNYAPVWDYVGLGERAKWKLDQFLQAMGVASHDRRKGEFDTKDLVGRKAQLRITRGQDLEGNYRPNVGGVYLPDGAGEVTDEEWEDEEEDWEEDEEAEPEDTAPLFTNEEIAAAKGKRLKEMVKEAQEAGYSITVPSGAKVGDVRDLLIDAMGDGPGGDEEDDDLDEDDDEVPF